jgi:hypothetical protein
MGDETTSELDGSECVLRLLWWSEDFDENDDLRPEAFPSRDIKDPARGVSVDRAHLATQATVQALADFQQPKKAAVRLEARVSVANVTQIQGIAITAVSRCLSVFASPTEATEFLPANPAHAHIASIAKFSGSQINEIRLELIKCFGKAIALNAFFTREASPPSEQQTPQKS